MIQTDSPTVDTWEDFCKASTECADIKIVAISGKAGSGKTTVSHHLADKYGYTGLNFADALKEEAIRMGWDAVKDDRGRKLLQRLGQVGREYTEDCWVNLLESLIKDTFQTDKVVVGDCRYKNEALWVRSKGGILLRIERPDNPWALKGDAAQHHSETDLDGFCDFDAVVVNDGTLDELREKIDEALSGKIQ